jgi:hypothetical protein
MIVGNPQRRPEITANDYVGRKTDEELQQIQADESREDKRAADGKRTRPGALGGRKRKDEMAQVFGRADRSEIAEAEEKNWNNGNASPHQKGHDVVQEGRTKPFGGVVLIDSVPVSPGDPRRHGAPIVSGKRKLFQKNAYRSGQASCHILSCQ